MALVASNVRVGVTGLVAFAPTGTALPTNSETALAVGYEDVGYISDEGVTQSSSANTNDIVAWQNGATVRKIQTSHDLTYSFTMLESSEASLTAFYGNYTAGVVEIDGGVLPRQVMVLDVVDGTHSIRVVLPDAQITETGDVQYVNGDAVSYPVTVTAFPDSSGVKAYLYNEVAAP